MSVTLLSILMLNVNIQGGYYARGHYVRGHYARCHYTVGSLYCVVIILRVSLFSIMTEFCNSSCLLIVIMMDAIVPSVIMLIVIM
jgi:hypothetical protein